MCTRLCSQTKRIKPRWFVAANWCRRGLADSPTKPIRVDPWWMPFSCGIRHRHAKKEPVQSRHSSRAALSLSHARINRDAMVDILVGTLIPIIYFISDARAVDLDRVEWWSYIHKKTMLQQRVCCMDWRQKQICVTITFSFLSMRRVRFDI